MTSQMQAQLKSRNGSFIDPMPDEDTMAKEIPFSSATKIGREYRFPVYLGMPGGSKFNDDHTAFAVPDAIAPVMEEATIAGSEWMGLDNVAYADLFATQGQENAHMTASDVKVLGLAKLGQMIRELTINYGPGSTSTAAANIGVVDGTVSGANLAAPQTIDVTQATWIPGLWPMMTNQLLDVYQTDGTTVRETGVTVQSMVAATNRLVLYKAASAATVAAGDILLLSTAIDKSCYGLEAITANTGSLFGISATTYAQWRCGSYSCGDQAIERRDVLNIGSQAADRGVSDGGTLWISNPAFVELSEEANELLQTAPSSNDVVVQGASQLNYRTSCGVISVKSYRYAKQSRGFFMPKGIAKRPGSTDLTFRDPMSKDDWFLQQLSGYAGLQMRCYWDQAVILEQPHLAFEVTAIQSSGDTAPA